MISAIRLAVRAWLGGWLGFFVATAAFGAADDVVNTRDTLVFKDGDRVQGTLVEKTAATIVFRSDRFGELRVKAGEAVVIKAEKPAEKVAAVAETVAAAAAATPEETAVREAEIERVTIWDRFSPGVLTAKVRGFFGPWHGRLSFSTEVVNDVAERDNIALEGRLNRKWERDEVQLSARYDAAQTDEVRTTDVLKASGSWRREFKKRWFAQYRPSVEWNRASKRLGVPNEYVLLQQEAGVGVNLYATPARKVRAGVSQNLFEIWNTAPRPDHSSRGVQSFFEEVELKLPWQMGISQRAAYYPVGGTVDGWENRIELNKKLTETLSTALRHEIRRNNPDGSAQDYTRLRLLFGLDF